MKRKSLKVRILSLVLAAAMASGTVVSAAETEKASGLAGVGNWFAERGKDIKEGAADAGDWIGNAAGEAWDATTNAASNAGKWIGDKANMAWNSTVEIAVDVGDWMGTKANNIWDSTEDARLWIGEKANETWNSATEAVTIAGTWISDNASDAWEKITKASDATGEWICDTAGDIQVISAEALDSAGQWIDETGKELVYFTTTTGEVVAAYVEDIDKEEVVDYLTKSGEKLVLGEYSEEDPTLLSIGGTLAASVVNLDIGMDIRDIVYDVQHLDSEDVEISDIALSAVGLIPIIGVIKPAKKFLDAADAVTTMAKVTDDVVDVAKAADAVSDVSKVAEVVSDAGKAAESVSNAGKVIEASDDASKAEKAVSNASEVAEGVNDADKVANSVDDIGKSTDAIVDAAKSVDKMDNAVEVVENVADIHKFNSLDEMKVAYKGNFIAFLKENKPKYSPDVEKWFDKGGTLEISEIDGKQIWNYTSSVGKSVPYIDGYVKFPEEYLHPVIGRVDIGGFSGDRDKDLKKLKEVLKRDYEINEIPDDYIVHHDTENGILNLVEKAIHEEFTHIGGHSMYKER